MTTLILFCAALLLSILLISFYTYRVAFYSPPGKRHSLDDPMHGEQYEAVSEHIYRAGHIMERYPFEKVEIHSFDNCKLFGRYYHVRDGAPLIILFHGYRSCAFRDCSGGHALSRKLGFNALVIDQRAHGRSGSYTITFGIKERRDCLCWIEYANGRFGTDTPIILSGISMGAATILMAAGLNLPRNVSCIMADSPYSAPSAIIEKVCADLHYPVTLCRPFIHLGALVFGRFRLNSCTAKEAVTHTDIPLLLIHGEDDRLVPCSMSKEIADCSVSSTVQTFSGAGHGLSYLIDPIRYEKVIFDFLRAVPAIAPYISENFPQRH